MSKQAEVVIDLVDGAESLEGAAEAPLSVADIRRLPRLSALAMALITAFGGDTAVHASLRGSAVVLTPVPRDEDDTPEVVHARIAGIFDNFGFAAAAIKQNQSNPAGAQPLRALAPAATLAVLKASASCMDSHRRVTYDDGNTLRELPALEPGDLTDVELLGPKVITISQRVTGLRRNTSTNLAGMVLGDDLLVETTWPWQAYGHALETPHFVEGRIESIDQGRWVLSQDAKLLQMPELPGLDAGAISPKLAPKASPRAKYPHPSPAPRRSGGRPQSRQRPKPKPKPKRKS